MKAIELIRTIEEAGGHFTVTDGTKEGRSDVVLVRGELGSAPAALLPLLEREKARIADFLLHRLFLEAWQPAPKGMVQ
jgi:hypothetical protein